MNISEILILYYLLLFRLLILENDYLVIRTKTNKENQLIIKIEQFIDKFLKNSNEVLKRHSIAIRKKGATAVYRCQHYRKIFLSLKICYLSYKKLM